MKKVAFYTLGCKLNFSETSTIGKSFVDNGFEIVDFSDYADVYVINTCTVTESADRECRQIIRRAKRKNPEAYIAVTGCYAQIQSSSIAQIEGVNAVFGTNDKFQLIEKIKDFKAEQGAFVCVTPLNEINSFYSASSTDSDSRTRAFLKIQDGCDYKCSYCTIPLARGKSRSANVQQIKEEFSEILKDGYKEIVLTGVNIGEFQSPDGKDLFHLIKELLKIEGEYRIRLGSIEPNLIKDELIDLIANEKRMCKHFHIPLQSGSDKILQLMQRRYNTTKFKKVVERINSSIKNVGIGIDVITGFPGETDAEFIETYNFLDSLEFSYLHVFTYSERENTKAIVLPEKVSHTVKKERTNKLRELSEIKLKEFQNKMIGKELEVLFENTVNKGMISGFAENYIRVKREYEEGSINKFCKVKVIE